MLNLPLSGDIRNFITYEKMKQADNLGLLFNKFIWVWSSTWGIEEKSKKQFLDRIKQIHPSNDCLNNCIERQKKILASYEELGYTARKIKARSTDRLVLGLGSAHILETGLTFHPLYGFPYLPASGLKGLARACAEIVDRDNTTDQLIREIFGSEDKDPKKSPPKKNRQGKVFFMDGLPVIFPILETDIMNPHYGDYYNQKKDSQGNLTPPADWLSPVPVYFLAIRADTTFQFGLFSKETALADLATKWLKGGLMDLGAGGKTNAGYGYFEIIDEEPARSEIRQKETSKVESMIGSLKAISPDRDIVHCETWQEANITWNPGNQTLTAVTEGKKALIKGKDLVPQEFHKTLFEKRKSVKVRVEVELIGGRNYKVVKIG